MDDKKITCPSCRSDKVRKYLYGHNLNADESKYIVREHLYEENNPRYHCDNCGSNFGETENEGFDKTIDE